jgi:hypothetical protein
LLIRLARTETRCCAVGRSETNQRRPNKRIPSSDNRMFGRRTDGRVSGAQRCFYRLKGDFAFLFVHSSVCQALTESNSLSTSLIT